jgi:hypothetical protein
MLFVIVVAVLLLYQIVRMQARTREIDELQRSGRRIAATVTNTLHERVQATPGSPPNPATHMPGRAPTYRDDWYVEAEWADAQAGETHHFTSERLDEDEALRYRAGDPITVLVDPSDTSHYYVEIVC